VRLLLDKNLSHRLAPVLEEHGHDVVHVDDNNSARLMTT
jgi:predicted nuclease of predicted toxin-antitoxin system